MSQYPNDKYYRAKATGKKKTGQSLIFSYTRFNQVFRVTQCLSLISERVFHELEALHDLLRFVMKLFLTTIN